MKVPKEHALMCPKCGKDIDLRDLSDVIYHEAGECIKGKKKKKVKFTSYRKLGESIEWVNGNPIHLN